MSNMSYCRFQNTLGDLEECREALLDMNNPKEELSEEEFEALEELVKVCKYVSDYFTDVWEDEE